MHLFHKVQSLKLASPWLMFLIVSCLPVSGMAQDSNFRLSFGRTTLDVSPNEAYSSDGQNQHHGWSIAGEMPQSDHTASRAQLYRIDDDRLTATGLEMQIMWGWGLASEGPRLYAGPSYFFEHRHDERATDDSFDVFRDIGVSAGFGYQYQRWVLDLNAQWRDPRSYERESKSRQRNDNVSVHSMQLLMGYQF